MDRRTLLRGLATAGAVAALPAGSRAEARVVHTPPEEMKGLLYDTTRCIGCKACVAACKRANELPAEDNGIPGGLHDAPLDLSAETKTVIKLYKGENESSFYKAQCLQCIDPACASACMLGAFQKREYGIVTWDGSKCVGCRYCQVACPFNIPQDRVEGPEPEDRQVRAVPASLRRGKGPGLREVCPRGAVVFGKRDELLQEAKARMAAEPTKYVPKIYGEHDGGGTQCLVLSHVDFAKLGLPDIGDKPAPDLARTVQHGVYKGFIAPVALYAVLGSVIWRNRRSPSSEEAAGTQEERP
jgi:Fe-S-cluster-containing dehydrogenase component